MLRTAAAVVCLSIAACHRPPPASPPSPEPVAEKIPICDSDKEIADIRAVARKYIPTITDPATHPLSAEIAHKAMVSSFRLMTAGMRPYPSMRCWTEIELQVTLARIDAAKARGEKL